LNSPRLSSSLGLGSLLVLACSSGEPVPTESGGAGGAVGVAAGSGGQGALAGLAGASAGRANALGGVGGAVGGGSSGASSGVGAPSAGGVGASAGRPAQGGASGVAGLPPGVAAGANGGSPGSAAGGGVSGVSGVSAGGGKGGDGAVGTGGVTRGAGGAAGAEACPPPAVGSKGQNPLFSDQYTADPAPFVHGCTFYIHCGHDEGQTGFVMKEWFVLSSTDMVAWTKKIGMNLAVFSWADANAWAGQLVEKSGKFYWYVPVNEKGSGMAIGVAVGDSPEGPFTDAIGHALVDDASEMKNWNFTDPGQTPYTIDPSVFVDDDGRAYLHYGGFGRMVQAKLGADMISIDGGLAEQGLPGFFEAPFLTKRAGKYYEIYAAGSNPATIDYATSASPLGPWARQGRVLDALPAAANQDAPTSHGGVAALGGQWYIVYHLSNGPNNGGTYKREVAVDKLTFNDDGTIQKVTPSAGLAF